MKEFKPAHLLRYSLLLYFLLPYLIFLSYYNFTFSVGASELFWVIKNSLLQAGLTSVLTLLLSVPMSQGLLLLPPKIQRIALRLLIVPQILPALYSVLIAFSVLNPYPMGSTGIVILFTFINLGFATLLMFNATRAKLGHLALMSEVYSIGRIKFLTKIFYPLLRSELTGIFFLIFIFCLSSFSIPLIVGGGRGTNVEVLIFEKIFVEQNWSAAFGLCLLQALLIFALSYFVLRTTNRPDAEEFSAGNYLKSYTGAVLIAGYLGVYFGGYLIGLIKSLGYFDFILQYRADLVNVTVFTTKALLIYLALNVVMLFLWVSDYLENSTFTPANNLISVSTVLIGFSLYLFFPLTRDYDILKIVFAMSVLFFPSLFKLFLQQPIENLGQQILIARMYGLSRITIIIEIIFRQLSSQLFLWFSFLIIWFISEYALLKALGVQTQTLGLFSEAFLSSYRLPLSYLMSLYILIYWAFAMLILYFTLKVVYVTYKKFTA